MSRFFFWPGPQTSARQRAGSKRKIAAAAALGCHPCFELVRAPLFPCSGLPEQLHQFDIGSGACGLPTGELRDHELLTPAETDGAIGISSSRSCLVDPSTTCSPHPGRALCPCEQLHATSWTEERQAAGIGIELTRWHLLHGPEGQLRANLHRPTGRLQRMEAENPILPPEDVLDQAGQ